MPRPSPHHLYRGVKVFLYHVVGMQPGEWGASIEWQKTLIDVEREDGKESTLEQMQSAAHQLIDDLLREKRRICR